MKGKRKWRRQYGQVYTIRYSTYQNNHTEAGRQVLGGNYVCEVVSLRKRAKVVAAACLVSPEMESGGTLRHVHTLNPVLSLLTPCHVP